MMRNLFNQTFNGLPVLITGHTGFKGAWLATWLLACGAKVIGYSLEAPITQPNLFDILQLNRSLTDVRGDLGDLDLLRSTIETYKPHIIFHLAAQTIVYAAYDEPKRTFDTNAGGTVNVLEAMRLTNSVRALVSVTTDKVYQNQEWLWGYRESDRLGDVDPYGASKAMAEIAIASYREAFFHPDRYDQHGVAIASVRAGNVIGGGDFAQYRLVPDCVRALLANKPIELRRPSSVRPWQHVLEPLSGYLALGARLLQNGPEYGEAWNFGPAENKGVSVQELVEILIDKWGSGSWKNLQATAVKPETGLLRLNWEKAAARLDWQPIYSLDEAAAEVAAWFKAYQAEAAMMTVTQEHIQQYVQKAKDKRIAWAH